MLTGTDWWAKAPGALKSLGRRRRKLPPETFDGGSGESAKIKSPIVQTQPYKTLSRPPKFREHLHSLPSVKHLLPHLEDGQASDDVKHDLVKVQPLIPERGRHHSLDQTLPGICLPLEVT